MRMVIIVVVLSGCACAVEFVIPPNVDCKMIGQRWQ